MGAFIGPSFLAATGTTGNNTHASIGVSNLARSIAILFTSEVAGTTITWKAQGTVQRADGVYGVADGSASWFDLPYVLPSTDTLSQAAIVRTQAGSDTIWLALSQIRFVQRLRLVTSANTGVTYRAELYQIYDH